MTALDGIKVLELARYISGPYCGMLLADLGADVTKVETGEGDPSRREGPWADGQSLYYAQMNRNKEAIQLDLRSEDGRDRLAELIQTSDVLIENFRPGTMGKMGFGKEKVAELNPRCITVSISGFGQESPYRDRGAFDEIVQSLTGLAAINGNEEDFPLLVGTHIVDATAALLATIGVLAAIAQRERDGIGQAVDISLVGAAVALLGTLVPGAAAGTEPERAGNKDRTSAPANAFRARDGWVYVHAGSDAFWDRALTVMSRRDLADDPQFLSESRRLDNRDAADAIVQEWVGSRSVEEVERLFNDAGVLAARVNTLRDAVRDPDLGVSQLIRHIAGIGGAQIPVTIAPITLERSPVELRRGVPDVSPATQGRSK